MFNVLLILSPICSRNKTTVLQNVYGADVICVMKISCVGWNSFCYLFMKHKAMSRVNKCSYFWTWSSGTLDASRAILAQVSKFRRGVNQDLQSASVREQPFPLPHCCGMCEDETDTSMCLGIMGKTKELLEWMSYCAPCNDSSFNFCDVGNITYWISLTEHHLLNITC